MSLFTATDGAQHRRVGGVLRIVNGAWELANDTDYQSDDLTLDGVGPSTITLTFPPAPSSRRTTALPSASTPNSTGRSSAAVS